MNSSLFSRQLHPFVWTTPADRADVLANVNDPIWHRFLEEAEQHFATRGELRPATFPVFCHSGDLDEVMAVSVLAYVRDERRYWRWIADWLRGLLAYYHQAEPLWRENRARIMRGEPTTLAAAIPNPRQYFEGFTEMGRYWVEAGLSSAVLHLLDLLEAYAPTELNDAEKAGLLEVIGNFADRYAFHEEAFKYNNRGMWANAGVLLAGVARANPKTGALLRLQSARRNEEFRSTFLDDGFHVEGAPDYHLMAADGLLAYLLTASHLEPSQDLFAGADGAGPFQRYPSFVGIVRAYLRTVLPGPVLMNNPRGCSVSSPVTVRPALVQAWRLTRDPEIGWFLRQRMGEVFDAYQTPLQVTKTALLGLGHYQPLLNFWLHRPVDEVRPPTRRCDVFPEHGGVFSRSGWGPEASCVTARYGYEGTGKGHRDHAHVSVIAGGVGILKDPFPRFGPDGLESSVFHNTVTLDNAEPAAVIGSLQGSASKPGLDAFLVSNSGGALPDRIFLHDPREETHYWFTNDPEPADFGFQRALLHLHDRCVVMVDRVVADRPRRIDWFFHSALCPQNYDASDAGRSDAYQLRRRNVATPPAVLTLMLRGPVRRVAREACLVIPLGNGAPGAALRLISLETPLDIETGHSAEGTGNVGAFKGEIDYFVRARTEAREAFAVWVVTWGDTPSDVMAERDDRGAVHLTVNGGPAAPVSLQVDFNAGTLELSPMTRGV